jgi:NADP-reducing hydrogenase subunit HndB
MLIEELEKIKKEYIEKSKKEAERGVIKILVHMGTCGIAAGAREIFNTLLEEKEKLSIDNIKLCTTGCAGLCSQEPMITIEIPGELSIRYGNLDVERVKEIFYSHVLGGEIKSEYAISTGLEKPQKRAEEL